MLTNHWTQLRYHEEQSKLWRTKARLVTVAAGRGSGKTDLARRRIVRMLPVKKAWGDPVYFYALPTINQARRIAWNSILRLIPPNWIISANKTEMCIETKFGSTLYVIGLDKPMRAEGLQYDGGVIDEASDQRPDVFNLTFIPALTHRHGWCWRIGVPKRYGSGAIDFHEACNEYLFDNDPTTASFTWKSAGIVPLDVLEAAKRSMDIRDYREQFEASWEKSAGCIFYNFNKDLHVTSQVGYDPELPIAVGSDFNVNPMAWTLSHVKDGQLRTFDELWIRHTNTEQTLGALHSRYGQHKGGWAFFGDASGKADHTSASSSDYIQIKNDERFPEAVVYYPKANPRITDRFAACTHKLLDAKGNVGWVIHPRCVHLINDLAHRAYKEGSREPNDKHKDSGHISDAIGYVIHRLWPVKYKLSDLTPQVSTQGS